MKLRQLVAGISLLTLLACEGTTEGVVVVNQPPSITFTFERLAVRKGLDVDLTVSVSDPNVDDDLSVSWVISRNSLTPANSSNTVMTWNTPTTLGTDTVRITVSDGELSTTIVEEIKVGTIQTATSRSSYTLDLSPYIITPDPGNPKLVIAAGVTVTIDPGVEILLDEPTTEIVVEGVLEVNGTALLPVLIKPNRRSAYASCSGDANWWRGIRVSTSIASPTASGMLIMNHAIVRNGEYAVRLTDSGSAVIISSALRCSRIAGVRISSSGSLTITDCNIDNNLGNGIDVRTGLMLTPPDSVSITDSRITINQGVGIEIDIDDQSGSVRIDILRNQIESNLTYGIRMSQAAAPTINFNSFFANGSPPGKYNIFLTATFPTGNNIPMIDATQNFWGADYATQAPIDETVWDSNDSPSVSTRLILDPWLAEKP